MNARFAVLFFLLFAAQGAFLPLFSLRLHELGFTPLEIGLAFAMPACAGIIAQLMVGQIADRWCRADRVLTVCGAIASGCMWLLTYCETPGQISSCTLGYWLAMGPATSLSTVVCLAHLANPARDFGRIRLWGTIGWVFSGSLVGLILARPAWLYGEKSPIDLADVFRQSSILALAFMLFTLTLPMTPPSRNRTSWFAPVGAFRLMREPDFATFIICSFGVSFTYLFEAQLASLLLRDLGVPEQWVGPTLTLCQSMEIVTLFLLPTIIGRIGLRNTMAVGLTAWMMLFTVLTIGKPLLLVILSLAFHGVCMTCFWISGQVFINQRAPQDVRASAQALMSFVNSIGGLCGSFMAGWIRLTFDGRFMPPFAFALGCSVMMLCIFCTGFRRREVPIECRVAA